MIPASAPVPKPLPEPVPEAHEVRFPVHEGVEVSALLLRPPCARAQILLAHGAGAGMRHPFMESLARALAARDLATFRYQFPYTEAGRRRPDRAPTLIRTVRAAVCAALEAEPGLPLIAGGKSMGGRMTSLAAAAERLTKVRGLVFVGFPLHPVKKPGTERADHLRQVPLPMLFLQGTRDKLAPLETLEPVLDGLGERATLHVVDGADHGFAVLKRSGRTADEVMTELARQVEVWVHRLI